MTNKLTRRHFLATLASAAAGALVAGVVKVEPEPAEWDDIGIKPLGPQYLIKDDFGDMSWTEPATDWYLTPEAGEDVVPVEYTNACTVDTGEWDGLFDTQAGPTRTVVDWDAGEDVRGLTLDAGILTLDWDDPWIDYGRLSFYVTEDRIVVKDGGMLTMRWLQGVEYVDAYLPLATQLLFVIVGPEYTEHLVYAGGRFRVWQRFVPEPASGLYPDFMAIDPDDIRI